MLLGLIGTVLPLASYAQVEGGRAIEEVVVTAQYREQSVQDVPIAMNAFSTEELEKASVTSLQDISRLAPDFTAINDLGFVRLSIRGVQSNSNDEGGDQALVFNIDGDYINRGNFINAAMFDLERVEVLRGPQGTLYGRNATGGAVNAIARKPSLEGLEGYVSADFGDYSSQIYNGAINFTLGSKFAIRVAAMSAGHDGYSSHPGFKATNDQDTQAYRLGLLFAPTEALSIYLAAEYAEEHLVPSYAAANANFPPYQADGPSPGTCSAPGWFTVATYDFGFGCAPYGTDYLSTIDRDRYAISSPWLGFRDQDTTAYRGSINYEGDSLTVMYRFAFRNSHWDGANPLPNLMFYRSEDTDNTAHELRFSGGKDGGLFWQAGLFYYKEDIDGYGGLHFPFGQQADPMGFGIYLNTFYRPNFESESKAAFGQIELPFADTFTAVLGARYTEDDKSGTFYNFAGPPGFGFGGLENLRPIEEANVVFPAKSNHNETTWTVGVNYQPSSDALHYAKISKGYKAGGFDSVGTYDPETVIAYEVGSKNQFENSLFNASAFYYDYTDLQASVLLDTTKGGQIFNAGSAEIWGLEAAYELYFTDNDKLKLTANYLSADYKEFSPLEEAVQCVPTGGPCDGVNTVPSDASGNKLPNSPEWIFTIGYDHIWNVGAGTLTGSIFSRYKDDYYNTVFNYNDGNQSSYTQTDVSLEYAAGNGNWSVLAYARNLEDERPVNYFNFISAGPSNDDYNWGFGAPRTYGVKLQYNF
jgi:iron complex outermembrane recepter protein